MANRTVTNLTAVLQMNNTKFKKGLTTSQKALKVFQKQVSAIGGMLAGAFAVGTLVNFGREAVQVAMKAQGIRAAFAQLNQPGLLDNLKQATRDTVAEVELMRYAVRAQNFKVPLEQLGSFFQFATQRAIQTGESVDYLVNSIIDGIGRKSTLVLDNLGISASELQAEMKKTGDFGKAAANIIEREMGKAGIVLDTTAIKAAQLKTGLQNLTETMGTALIHAATAVSDAFQAVYNPLQYASTLAARDIDKALSDINQNLKNSADIEERMGGLSRLKDEIKKTREEYDKLMGAVKTPAPFAGLTEGEDGFYSPGGLNIGLDWATNPQVKSELQATIDMIALMDEQTEEWLEGMDDDMRSEFFPNMRKAGLEARNLGTTIVFLGSQFTSLGTAIADSLSGAEKGFSNLGTAIMDNLGSILIMIGSQMGPKGLPLVIIGAGMQLGSGIIKGLGNKAEPVASPSYSHNVQFKIQGQDLVGVMRNTDIRTNYVS